MSDGKWMFGGSSDPSLLVANNEKKTFFNRELGDNYTEGFQIGENETSDGYQNKRAEQHKTHDTNKQPPRSLTLVKILFPAQHSCTRAGRRNDQ